MDDDKLIQKLYTLYTAPFKYEGGYIFDAEHHMVADDHESPFRVRGWGYLQYRFDSKEEAARAQDILGEMLAQAMTMIWEEHARSKIPEGVYYSKEMSNFYDQVTHQGMGHDFYQKWFDRRNEFPQGWFDKA